MIQTTESLNDDDQSITSPSRQPLAAACNSMRMQILSRAFYGWLAHCRHLRTIRTHLVCLVKADTQVELQSALGDRPLDSDMWMRLREDRTTDSYTRLCTHVYHHGVSPGLRAAVWPHLLQLVPWDDNVDRILPEAKVRYEASMREWLAVEAIVKQRDDERFAAARERELHERLGKLPVTPDLCERATLSFDEQHVVQQQQQVPGGGLLSAVQTMRPGECSTGRSTPEKSVGGCAYSKELVDTFALHLHRIEKDVSRCDRNHAYFALESNLDKLRNVMCTYVWQNLDLGYVQGMCDLAAPLLVVFDDETLSHGCFSRLMDRMWPNFPHGAGMDARLANTRALVQVAEPELFELMHRNGDYTHFYFAYRWFLLDFKREFAYEDMYTVWEVIWSASTVISDHFSLFLALALLQMYREIILDNNMDFTDIIKFFNEMAERHDAELALRIAREQLKRLCDVVRQDL